jgi:hypothetical protein
VNQMMKPIRVSTKTLAHISSGLYRSTSGALKELVSNAFDADATEVRITTNKPSFDVFTITDNGNGLLLKEFEQLMKGGIGFSSKRVGPGITPLGRPVIGRLGIGLLAMTQLSHGFRLVSHHKESKTAFEAQIVIRDYLPTKADEESKVDEKTEIGQYEASPVPFEQGRAGVSIVSSQMRTGLIRRFRQSRRTNLPLKFGRYLQQLEGLQSVSREGPYWDLVWGLSTYCPIKYPRYGPVHGKAAIEEIRRELEAYDFELVIDGMPLRKPIRFPLLKERKKGIEYFVKEIRVDDEVEGQKLRIEGYVFAQEGKAITPVEFRGILIRIRNVAVGTYDKTFLDYEIAEGPRFGWLTGELYVHEGLEDALNVDRDSFNVSHPHYLKLREVLHTELQEVFSTLYKGIDRRSQAKIRRLIITRDRSFLADLKEIYEREFVIERTKGDELHSPVEIDVQNGVITISDEADWPREPDKKQFAQQLLVAWELSVSLPNMKSRRSRFQELYKRILGNFGRW